jgi:hypothetical protein
VFGGERMKEISKKLGVGIISLVFLLALVSANPVEAITPLRMDYSASYTFEPEWTGVIIRDDGVTGTLCFDVIEWVDLATIQKSSGIWWINWADGGYLEGTQNGKVIWAKGEYVINGKVTATSDDVAYLDGRNVHIMGTIDMSFFPYTTTGVFQIN